MWSLSLAERMAYWSMILRLDWIEENAALNRARFEETQAALRDAMNTLRVEIRHRESARSAAADDDESQHLRQPELFQGRPIP